MAVALTYWRDRGLTYVSLDKAQREVAAEVCILLSPDRSFVRLVKMFEVKPFVPAEALNAVLRNLSNGYDVARFRSFRDGSACADYSMTYEFGLSPQQLVEMPKGFTWTVKEAFRGEECAGLLEG